MAGAVFCYNSVITKTSNGLLAQNIEALSQTESGVVKIPCVDSTGDKCRFKGLDADGKEQNYVIDDMKNVESTNPPA